MSAIGGMLWPDTATITIRHINIMSASAESTKSRTKPQQPARWSLRTIVLVWLGVFLAIAALALLTEWQHTIWIFGSFGGSCILIFAYPSSPFAQPRNVVGGHFIASLTGLVFLAIGGNTWWSVAAAVATAIALMLYLRVPHPPAGSNTIFIMLAQASWSFLLLPTLMGSLILVLIGLLYNNIRQPHSYPLYW